ncbi:DinB family protein [Tahibacter amnicola]|uniref:DinB family protein n=1 Tax=Tahibacter amnicola TaxID=2976241 RepID=A0ABY6BCX3_9GAMM|nr:DinB family protein [Tahibacter amnicola]UXI67652.1 DinB family protein [Tahibacter amnicola]
MALSPAFNATVPPSSHRGQNAYAQHFDHGLDRMDLHQHLRLMADYHYWALQRLYAEVDELSDDDYRADCGQFFKSIHGTLNHILLAEQIWQARMAGTPHSFTRLDQEIESDRDKLRDHMLAFCRGWRPFVDKLTPEQVAGDLDYLNLKGEPFTMPFASLVLHVFNHATHHRGQASIGLMHFGRPAPVMDLPYFLIGLPRERLHAP